MLPSTAKLLNFKDIVLISIVANFGVRWLAVAAGIGAPAILFWFLGALLFFVPISFMSAQLSRLYPEEGGLYAWTRHAMGEKNGFIVAWLYWVNNVFYYPAILIFLATNFAYFLGKPALANNHVYILVTVLIAFWLIIIVSLYGLKASKYVAEAGGILGTIVPTVFLILLGFGALFYFGHSATNYSPASFLPGTHVLDSLSTLTIIMFAMAGIEIIPTFANSVKNPKRDLYLGLLIGALGIFVMYTIGTVAMNIIVPPSALHDTSGLMQAFTIIASKFHIPWLARVLAFLLVFAELAAISIWLIAPITMFFKCTPKGLLPDWFHQTNRYNAPGNAVLFMGVLVTVIILLTSVLPSINEMYQALVLMATILYFIPYIFMAVVYLKSSSKIKGKKWLHSVLAIGVFISMALGIAFSFEPPGGMTWHNIVLYEIELIVGPVIFIVMGYIIYFSRKKYTQLD